MAVALTTTQARVHWLAWLTALAFNLLPTGIAQAETAAPLGRDIYYYDGDKRLYVVRDPDYRILHRTDGSMVLAPRDGSRVASRDKTGEPLEVYRQGRSRMTLPGGVIVRFDPSWSRDDIETWLGRWGSGEHRAFVGDHIWLIATPPGLTGLHTANRIHESGEVVYATPNWARPRFTR